MEPDAARIVERDLQQLVARLDRTLEHLSGRQLLITGGAGFLGHYLVQVPLAWNWAHPEAAPISVHVHDNFRRGVPAWMGNLASSNLAIVEHDVLQPLPEGLRPDYIIHAASIASPTYYRRHPIETMDANVHGLRLLLDAAAERAHTDDPVVGMLFFSTSEIYGDPDPSAIPTPETYRGFVSCTGPRACYDESKRYGETLCVNFAQQHQVPVTTVRPFNNYGPGLRLDDRRIIPDLASDILAGRDVTLLSDGRASRTFCYVADAVDGYFRALVQGLRGEAYNIGNDRPEVSMGELADRVVSISRRVLDYRGAVVTATSDDADYLTDNPQRRCPVITKARDELAFEPSVDLDDGLERTLRWYAGGGGR